MIFYFSATGNSKWAAQYVAEELGEELRFIPDEMATEMRYTLRTGEPLGFIIPIHGWRPPILVRRFLDCCHFSFESRPYTYLIYTAGDSIGRAAELMEADLARHRLSLDARLSLIMPESYVGLPFMDVDKPAREHDKKTEAGRQLAQFTQEVLRPRISGVSQLVKGPLPGLFSGLIGGFFLRHLVSDKRFRVCQASCRQCGLCARVCPVGNIDGGSGRYPTWQHSGKCLTCFACYHYCPSRAISFGRATQHKGQYYYQKSHYAPTMPHHGHKPGEDGTGKQEDRKN